MLEIRRVWIDMFLTYSDCTDAPSYVNVVDLLCESNNAKTKTHAQKKAEEPFFSSKCIEDWSSKQSGYRRQQNSKTCCKIRQSHWHHRFLSLISFTRKIKSKWRFHFSPIETIKGNSENRRRASEWRRFISCVISLWYFHKYWVHQKFLFKRDSDFCAKRLIQIMYTLC